MKYFFSLYVLLNSFILEALPIAFAIINVHFLCVIFNNTLTRFVAAKIHVIDFKHAYLMPILLRVGNQL